MIKTNKVFVIALCYGEQHIEGMISACKIFVDNNFKEIETQILIVDNKEELQNGIGKYGGIYIGGDNSNQEFSG